MGLQEGGGEVILIMTVRYAKTVFGGRGAGVRGRAAGSGVGAGGGGDSRPLLSPLKPIKIN